MLKLTASSIEDIRSAKNILQTNQNYVQRLEAKLSESTATTADLQSSIELLKAWNDFYFALLIPLIVEEATLLRR